MKITMHIKDISSSIYEDSLLKNLIWSFFQFSKIGNLNIVVIAHPSLVNISICIHVNIQNLKRKRGIKHNHTQAIKRRFREIVDYISTGTRKSIF